MKQLRDAGGQNIVAHRRLQGDRNAMSHTAMIAGYRRRRDVVEALDWIGTLSRRSDVPHESQRRRRADLRVGDHLPKLRRIFDRLTVEADDDVAGPETRFVQRRAPIHLRHDRAVHHGRSDLFGKVGRHRVDAKINRAPPDFAVLHQVVDDVPRDIVGTAKPMP